MTNTEATNIEAIVQRLHSACDTRNAYQLCQKLNLSSSAVSGWIKRQNIPYTACFRCSQLTGYSMEWLITGQVPLWANNQAEQGRSEKIVIDQEQLRTWLLSALTEYEKQQKEQHTKFHSAWLNSGAKSRIINEILSESNQ